MEGEALERGLTSHVISRVEGFWSSERIGSGSGIPPTCDIQGGGGSGRVEREALDQGLHGVLPEQPNQIFHTLPIWTAFYSTGLLQTIRRKHEAGSK
jgi:hypothetical protein